jgi:hypothetical protein
MTHLSFPFRAQLPTPVHIDLAALSLYSLLVTSNEGERTQVIAQGAPGKDVVQESSIGRRATHRVW